MKHDIALPISAIGVFVARADAALREVVPDVRIINFGHVGDGNLHYNVLLPTGASESFATVLNRVVHDVVASLNGSISAERGVGQLRRAELQRYKSEVELDLMLRVKRGIDPNQIMNPGKLL